MRMIGSVGNPSAGAARLGAAFVPGLKIAGRARQLFARRSGFASAVANGDPKPVRLMLTGN